MNQLRLQDFRCATHGLFEQMIEVDVHRPDYEPVRSHACPSCGELAPTVWTKAPGMQPQSGVHAIQMPDGRIYRRDDMEAFLDRPATKDKTGAEKEAEREHVHEVFSRVAYQEMHGNLPPQAELSNDQRREVEAAVSANGATVDPERVKAHSEQLVKTMRTTEFRE